MQKKVTIAAAGAALALGGAAAIAVPALADSTPTPGPSASSRPAPGGGEQRETRIKDQLKSLVDDGTITQAQADKVAAKLAQAGPQAGPRDGARGQFRGGPGRGGPPGFGPELQKAQATAAQALGISEDELREGLQAGKTLATLAKENGKTTDDVVNPLVAQARQGIAQAVTDKKLSQEQADRLSENLEQRVRGFVEDGHLNLRFRDGGRGHDGRTGPGDGAPSGAAPSSTT